MKTNDLENKDKAEKIHHLLLEIGEQQQQAKHHFKYHTLPFIIIIAMLLFTAVYLIYPYLFDFMETLIDVIEKQPHNNYNQKTPDIMVYEVDQQGIPTNQLSKNTRCLNLDHLI